ncbi:MAG: hypothetical protein Q7T54_05945 [Candidatus Levybacteria bacterium]|nr:hypothetical protein [Candidatus Levybacteria bacterium]
MRNPIPGGPKIPSSRGKNISHLLPVGALGLALLILPLTIQQLSQQQDVRQQASQPTPTIIVPTKATPTPSNIESLVPPVSTTSGTTE